MFTSTFVKLQLALEQFKKDQRGVTAIEYAVIGVAIATILGAVFASDGALDTALDGALSTLNTKMGN